MPNIVTITVNSTHFFLIDCLNGRLLVDAGWDMARFAAQMKSYKIPFAEIRYVMFTHHHPDHAGLIQEVRERSGARLLIHEKQIPYLADLYEFQAKKGSYSPIRIGNEDLVSPDRAALRAVGIQGELVETPGHSPDSLSLVLDSGEAFTGDLHPPAYEMGENQAVTCASWKALVERGARRAYPSHGEPFPVEQILGQCPGKLSLTD